MLVEEARESIKLTDEEVTAVFNTMPNGAQGFLKEWGYQQFADSIMNHQLYKLGNLLKGLWP